MKKLSKELENRVRAMASVLNFDECLTVYEQLPAGHPFIDLLFERMEQVDAVKFDKFLDYEI